MRALHELNIIHRDLKLQNLVKCNGKIKIIDLGLSKKLDTEDSLTESRLGTPATVAVEIWKSEAYGTKADIYSLGVILF